MMFRLISADPEVGPKQQDGTNGEKCDAFHLGSENQFSKYRMGQSSRREVYRRSIVFSQLQIQCA